MMRRRTSFDADQARLKPPEQRQKLIAPHLPAQYGLPLPIDPMNLEHVLGDVEADRGNLHVDGSFPLMVTDSTILAHRDAARLGAVQRAIGWRRRAEAPMWTSDNRGHCDRSGLHYPNDLADAEGHLVRPFLLSSTKSGGTPERLCEILNAVLYVLSTACQWRALPKDLPPRSTVHGWFVRWHCDGVLDRLHFALYQQVHELEGRHASPTTAIVDSQSVKSAEKGGGTSTRSAVTWPRRSRARSGTSLSTGWACIG
jgi:transposase